MQEDVFKVLELRPHIKQPRNANWRNHTGILYLAYLEIGEGWHKTWIVFRR